jgi:hypothetical protein
MSEQKISEMTGVREYMEGAPVELWRVGGRLVITAWNECGNNCTHVDLLDAIDWLHVNNADPVVQWGAIIEWHRIQKERLAPLEKRMTDAPPARRGLLRMAARCDQGRRARTRGRRSGTGPDRGAD